MSETESKNPGLVLKTQREKLGLSINDISLATKISPRILRALEDGQKTDLPPSSFLRGFIRSYANYLKLDAKAIIEAFELTSPPVNIPSNKTRDNGSGKGQAETPADIKPQRTDVSKMDRPSVASNLLIVSVIVILVVLIFGIKKVVDRYAQERVVPTAEQVQNLSGAPLNPEPGGEKSDAPEEGAAAAEVANADAASDANVAALDAAKNGEAIKPSDEIKVTPAAKPTEAPKVTEAPKPTPTPKPTEAPKPTPSATPAPSPTPTPTPKPTEAATKPSKPQEIIIEALDAVEITLRVDGGDAEKIKMKPESVHTIKAKKDVVLEISDGGLVNIIQNGSDRGNPGALGKSVKVSYP